MTTKKVYQVELRSGKTTYIISKSKSAIKDFLGSNFKSCRINPDQTVEDFMTEI